MPQVTGQAVKWPFDAGQLVQPFAAYHVQPSPHASVKLGSSAHAAEELSSHLRVSFMKV